MAKGWTMIKITREAKEELDKRWTKVNSDLRRLGSRRVITKIDLANFLLSTRIFISDRELKEMARRRMGRKRC